jgi:deoxycytidine triphosphate deaminase
MERIGGSAHLTTPHCPGWKGQEGVHLSCLDGGSALVLPGWRECTCPAWMEGVHIEHSLLSWMEGVHTFVRMGWTVEVQGPVIQQAVIGGGLLLVAVKSPAAIVLQTA